MSFAGLYIILMLAVIILFIGTGSISQRIQHNWQESISLLIIYFIIRIPIRKIASLANNEYKDKKPISFSCTTRIIFAIIGFLLFMTGIAELIWAFIPYKTPLYGVAIILCFPGSVGFLSFAFYDPNKRRFNFDVLKKQ